MKKEKDKRNIYEKFPLFVPGLVGSTMLLIAVLPIEEYAYYRILRWAICIIAAFTAYKSYEAKKHFWVFSSIAIAILFNPLIPIHLDKEIWMIIDLITSVLIFIPIWVLKSEKAKDEDSRGKNI